MRDRARRGLGSLFRAITRLEELCLAWGILGIAGLTISNVLLRTFTGSSLLAAEELSQFAIVWVTFLGLGYGASQGRHIRMTAFYDAMSDRGRKRLMLLISSTTSVLLLVLTGLSLDYIFGTVAELAPVSPVLQVPRHLVYLAAPLGFFLAAIQYALTFVKNLTTDEVYVSFERKDELEGPPPEGV